MDIAFLGDSLTEGRPGAAYLPLLAQRLPQHRLLNHGRAGDTVPTCDAHAAARAGTCRPCRDLDRRQRCRAG